jgi:uncharacterized protein with FMN-binding domain
MRRAPIVAVATAAGLAGVLAFHSKSAPLTLGIASSATISKDSAVTAGGARSSRDGTSRSTGSASTTTTPSGTSTTTVASTTTVPSTSTTGPASSTTSPSTSTTTTVPSTTRTATGSSVNYTYGALSVSVTATGRKLTNVGIASLDDGGNFRSQSIDQQSIPLLEQEALQAQSANIQGVSGASYTSAGFEQSLQSALNQLGIS